MPAVVDYAPAFQPGTHFYSIVSQENEMDTLFVMASVYMPRVSWRLYAAIPRTGVWIEDPYLANYFGPVDRWRLRPLSVEQARSLLDAWAPGYLPAQP